MTTIATFDTAELISLLGSASDSPKLGRFLAALRIYDRPKTVAEFEADDLIEDDGETDGEYELEQASKESMVVQSERLGLCLIFQPREDYGLVHDVLPESDAPFVLYEVTLFAKGVQIYQQYQGALPRATNFDAPRSDRNYAALGSPIARREVHETSTDLFVIDDHIVNFSFDGGGDGVLRLVHIRAQNNFDRKMLAPEVAERGHEIAFQSAIGAKEVGLAVASPDVVNLFATLGIDEDEMDEGVCPEEIIRLAKPKGLTLYFRDHLDTKSDQKKSAQTRTQRLAAMSYKRRGDLGSNGYGGGLPFGFEFGDSPDTLLRKVNSAPAKEHRSDELLSYYWNLDSGGIVQAVCSLLDWQLYRVTVFAPFMARELGV